MNLKREEPDNVIITTTVYGKTRHRKSTLLDQSLQVHITITNTNMFVLCEKKGIGRIATRVGHFETIQLSCLLFTVGFLLRVDVGSLESHTERMVATLEGIKFGPVIPVGNVSSLHRKS